MPTPLNNMELTAQLAQLSNDVTALIKALSAIESTQRSLVELCEHHSHQLATHGIAIARLLNAKSQLHTLN